MPKSTIVMEPTASEQQALEVLPGAGQSHSTGLAPIDADALADQQYEAVRNLLTQRTPKEEIRTRKGRGGMGQRYVDHAYVTRTLNFAFRWRWNFTILEDVILEVNEKFFEAACRGRLEVWFPGSPTPVVKEQYGSQPIEYMRDGITPVSLGDARKGAASDALKKCASLLGVALDLYDSDFDFREPEQTRQDNKQAAQVKPVAPGKPTARPAEDETPKGNPSQPTEQELLERATELVETGQVEKSGDVYYVGAPHQTSGKVTRFTVAKRNGTIQCNCPDGSGKDRCLHRLAVAVFVTPGVTAEKPKAQVKESSIVDTWLETPGKWKVRDKTLREELADVWHMGVEAGMCDDDLKALLGVKSKSLMDLQPDDAQDFILGVQEVIAKLATY